MCRMRVRCGVMLLYTCLDIYFTENYTYIGSIHIPFESVCLVNFIYIKQRTVIDKVYQFGYVFLSLIPTD